MDRKPNRPARAREPGLQWVKPSELTPHPRNPRKHSEEVLRLARTIARLGFARPVVASARSGHTLAGHGAAMAALEIAAGIDVDGKLVGGAEHWFSKEAPGPGLIPVHFVDADEARESAIMLADNSRALQGKDDAASIVDLAREFERDDPAMIDIGLDGDALDALEDKAGGSDELELHEVDVSDASDARFWLSIEGPLPSQPDVLQQLKRALEQLPGVKVQFV